VGRRGSDDFAIGVDRHGDLGLDIELHAFGRTDFLPRTMRARPEGPKHQRQLPKIFHLETVQIEMTVIDLRMLLDDIAATIMHPVADGDLIGVDRNCRSLFQDTRLEVPGLCKHLDGRKSIA